MSNEGWDDEFDELFSFGSSPTKEGGIEESSSTAAIPPNDSETEDVTKTLLNDNIDKNTATKEDSNDEDDDMDLFGPKPDSSTRDRTTSSDSFINMLDTDELPSSTQLEMNDTETQDILNWLDEEKPTSGSALSTTVFDDDNEKKEEQQKDGVTKEEERETAEKVTEVSTEPTEEQSSPETEASPSFEPTIVSLPPQPTEDEEKSKNDSPEEKETETVQEDQQEVVVEEPAVPTFKTLAEALQSPESTMEQIRTLFAKDGFNVDNVYRPHLWCKTVCGGKSLEGVISSSIADSFQEWDTTFDMESGDNNDDERTLWIKEEAAILAERIVVGTTPDAADPGGNDAATTPGMTLEEAKRSLCSVLLFHYKYNGSTTSSDKDESAEVMDPLLPPVACALLSAGIPTTATSVMLSNIIPVFMPLLALKNEERMEAAKSLHSEFYLLACYHLPLLVFHLDRYAPGWHWPKQLQKSTGKSDGEESATEKGRNLEANGVVPQSWLISHLAGECDGAFMNPKWLTRLWDLILVSNNNSLRFFLSLAVLEKHADTLLMLTGDKLIAELNRIMEFKEGTTLEGFSIDGEEDTAESDAVDWVQEWCDRARILWESTPRSVVSQLRSAEDAAFQRALRQRQRDADEALQARLEAEAKAHRETVEAEKERRLEEARAKLSRARLVAYYRKHNPEKEKNVDKILKTYEGRLEVLDAKLKAKYGSGFNPALKPKPLSKGTTKLLSTMNQGVNVTRRKMSERWSRKDSDDSLSAEGGHQVTVTVTPQEVLPVMCWSKEGAARGMARGRGAEEMRVPLKFYLVDSRPDDVSQEQGRFPTAVSMSPEMLLNPDRMQQHEDMFESLRGAVHICVMGEGFSALPSLYGQKLNPKLQQLMEEDASRTSLCALFFVKKGFPFVSILDGGFAAAHAWLSREGPTLFLKASSVLVDYDENISMFAQLEAAHQDTALGKTQRALQNLVEGSMTSLTVNKYRLENLASEFETTEGRQKVRESVTKLFQKQGPTQNLEEAESNEEGTKEPTHEGESKFHNPFAGLVDTLKKIDEHAKEKTAKKEPEDSAPAETTDVEISAEENEKPVTNGNVQRFRNPFAGRKESETGSAPAEESVDSSNQEGPKVEKKSEQEQEAGVKRNPFAGLGSALTKASQGEPKEEKKADNEQEAGVKRNPFAGFASLTKSSNHDSPKKEQKPNRFASFGAAINKSGAFAKGNGSPSKEKSPSSQQMPSALTKNPFARFGSKTAESSSQSDVAAKVESGPKTNRFAGLMSRVQAKQSADEAHDDTEESVSFVDEEDSVESSEATLTASSSKGAAVTAEPDEGAQSTETPVATASDGREEESPVQTPLVNADVGISQ